MLKGIILSREKNYSAALVQFNNAIEISGNCYPAVKGAADCLLHLNEPEKALTLLGSLEGKIPVQTDRLEMTARAYFMTGNYEESSKIVTEALKLEPENEVILFLKTRILFAQGHIDQAGRFLSLIERKGNQSLETVILRAQILDRSGMRKEAEKILAGYLPRYKDNADFLELYGTIMLRSAEPEKGRMYLERLLEIDPERIPVLDSLLDDAVLHGDWTRAESFLDRVYSLRKSDKYEELGYKISMNLGKLDRALSYAASLYSSDRTVYSIHLVRALLAAGKTGEAVKTIDEALSLNLPSEMRSMLYFYKSEVTPDRTKKIDILRNALLENLQNTDALLALARLFADSGDYKSAVRYMKQAQSLLPDDKEIMTELGKYEKKLNTP